MAKPLREWVETDVRRLKQHPVKKLSEVFFFRDPLRAMFANPDFFFSPADGVILYQQVVRPGESIVDIKGKNYSVQEAMRDQHFEKECLVIGIFMTFYDVYVNRVPYRGRLSYRTLDPIDTYNLPMLDVETSLTDELRLDLRRAAPSSSSPSNPHRRSARNRMTGGSPSDHRRRQLSKGFVADRNRRTSTHS